MVNSIKVEGMLDVLLEQQVNGQSMYYPEYEKIWEGGAPYLGIQDDIQADIQAGIQADVQAGPEEEQYIFN